MLSKQNSVAHLIGFSYGLIHNWCEFPAFCVSGTGHVNNNIYRALPTHAILDVISIMYSLLVLVFLCDFFFLQYIILSFSDPTVI